MGCPGIAMHRVHEGARHRVICPLCSSRMILAGGDFSEDGGIRVGPQLGEGPPASLGVKTEISENWFTTFRLAAMSSHKGNSQLLFLLLGILSRVSMWRVPGVAMHAAESCTP